MYQLKNGVSLHVTPEIEKMLSVIHPVFRAYFLPVVITSGIDGPHRQGSLHYKFRAIDIRKNFLCTADVCTWSMHQRTILDALRINFSMKDYPVNIVNEQDHLHIEWNGI
jgi:hypothetical protein